MDLIGALVVFLVMAVAAAAVLLLRAGFARRWIATALALAALALSVTAVHPLWRNPQHGPGGLMSVFIAWAGLVFGGTGLALGLWFGAMLFGRRPMLASWVVTFALAALVAGAILPPILYLEVEIRTAAHAGDLSESLGSVSAEVFARPHPALMKVFRYTARRAEVLAGYGTDANATGPVFYLYLQRDGVRWRVSRAVPIDNSIDALAECFTVPPYR